MKIIKYRLLANGKVPQSMVDGGYFPKHDGGQSPQDYDLIGYSLGWSGLGEFSNKQDFESYIKSFNNDSLDNHDTIQNYTIQNIIDDFWNKYYN